MLATRGGSSRFLPPGKDKSSFLESGDAANLPPTPDPAPARRAGTGGILYEGREGGNALRGAGGGSGSTRARPPAALARYGFLLALAGAACAGLSVPAAADGLRPAVPALVALVMAISGFGIEARDLLR